MKGLQISRGLKIAVSHRKHSTTLCVALYTALACDRPIRLHGVSHQYTEFINVLVFNRYLVLRSVWRPLGLQVYFITNCISKTKSPNFDPLQNVEFNSRIGNVNIFLCGEINDRLSDADFCIKWTFFFTYFRCSKQPLVSSS